MSPEPADSPESSPTLPYAKTNVDGNLAVVKQPGQLLRSAQIACAVSILGAVGAFFVSNLALAAIVTLGWAGALGALIGASDAARWNQRWPRMSAERRSTARVSCTVALAGILLVGHTFLGLTALSRMREYSKACISSANLLGIGAGLTMYVQDHGEPPTCFDDLVTTGINVPAQLVSRSDPVCSTPSPTAPYYSSYVYRPGRGAYPADPGLIVAFERTATASASGRLIRERLRWVLFADGRVELFNEAAFEEALRKDEKRRGELGWPIPPVP